MGSLERDLKRLEDKADYQRTELVCTVCGWEVTVYGDVWLDLIVLDWSADQPEERETFGRGYDPGVVELYKHEHSVDGFREKKRGLRMYDPTLSEIGETFSLESDEDGF